MPTDIALDTVPMPEGVQPVAVHDLASFDAAVARIARDGAAGVGILVGAADDDTCSQVAVLTMLGVTVVRTPDVEHLERVTNVIDALTGCMPVEA
jgi:hypothetical protein